MRRREFCPGYFPQVFELWGFGAKWRCLGVGSDTCLEELLGVDGLEDRGADFVADVAEVPFFSRFCFTRFLSRSVPPLNSNSMEGSYLYIPMGQ
jgi:hypothetical protein